MDRMKRSLIFAIYDFLFIRFHMRRLNLRRGGVRRIGKGRRPSQKRGRIPKWQRDGAK